MRICLPSSASQQLGKFHCKSKSFWMVFHSSTVVMVPKMWKYIKSYMKQKFTGYLSNKLILVPGSVAADQYHWWSTWQWNTMWCRSSSVMPSNKRSWAHYHDGSHKKSHKRSPAKMQPPKASRPLKFSKKMPTRFERSVSQLKTIAELSVADPDNTHPREIFRCAVRDMPFRSQIILQ